MTKSNIVEGRDRAGGASMIAKSMPPGTDDRVAQELAHEAMEVSDRIGELFDNMPYPTVRGALTRRELRDAKELLERAADVLSGVLKRELPKYESYAGWIEREERGQRRA